MIISIDVVSKLREFLMEYNGSVECTLYFGKYNSEDMVKLPFRLDSGADRTFTSLFNLMYKLGYPSQFIKDNLSNMNDQTMEFADSRKIKAYFIRLPYISFMDSYFTGSDGLGFPIYVDCPQDNYGNIDYEEIDFMCEAISEYKEDLRTGKVTSIQVDEIEKLSRRSADSLLDWILYINIYGYIIQLNGKLKLMQ